MTKETAGGTAAAGRRAFFLFGLLALAAVGGASARDDQVWLNFAVNASPWDSGVLLHFDQEVEMDCSRLTDEETYLSAGYRLCRYASLYAGHRIVRARGVGGHLETEQRPTLEANLYAPEFWTLKFSFRSRFEFRDKASARHYMRYRERFLLGTSWGLTDFHVSPYASMELFFSDKPGVSASDAFDCTRTQAGLTFVPCPCEPRLKCIAYYMAFHYISNGARDWRPMNVYGFGISYDI